MTGIRIVATDLDGTLVHSSGEISAVNRAALERARAAGVEIVICTGRRHSYAMRVLKSLPSLDSEVVISSNGAVTRTGDGGLLWRTTLKLDLLRRLCATLKDFRSSLVITYDRFEADGDDSQGALLLEDYDHLHNSIRKWIEVNASSIRRIKPLEDAFAAADAEEPIQAMLCGTMQRMHAAERMIAHSFSDELVTFRTEYPGQDLCILDILPKGQSKGTALLQVAAWRGVAAEEVVAIGDNWNDEPMFRVAGKSIVLANAPADLKEHALRRGWRVGRAGDEDGFSSEVGLLLNGAL